MLPKYIISSVFLILDYFTIKMRKNLSDNIRTNSSVRTTMVVRLHPGQSKRLSAYLDQKVRYSD